PPGSNAKATPGAGVNNDGTDAGAEQGEITVESLNANLPLTEEQKKAANEKIAESMFGNGQAFQDLLEDYNAAIKTYEELLAKYPDNKNREHAFFNLYYCYTKTGKNQSADSALMALKRDFPQGE